jgi:hypothetical protein
MDYRQVLTRLPAFNLDIPYKKPERALFMAVPKGRRMLAWFTYHRRKNMCFLVNPYTKSIVPATAAFSTSLSLGTLLSGVMLDRTFVVDDIFHLKGVPVRSAEALAEVASEWGTTRFLPKQLMFVLAETSYEPFVVSEYPQFCLKSLAPLALYPANPFDVLTVTATEQGDIYEADKPIMIDTLERSLTLKTLFHTCKAIPMVCQLHPVHKKWVPMFTAHTI